MAVPLRRCSSQNGSGYTPALTATARRTGVGGSDTVGNLKGLNFGLSQPVSARRAHLPTSITVPPRPLAPWEEAFLCPQTVMHQATHSQQSMRIHNRTLKCGFPIAPAHTKWDVSSDYQHCSLLASGASILDLFFFFFHSVLSMWAHKLTLSFQISISKLNTQKNVPLPSIHSKQAQQSELVAIKRFLLLCFQQLDAFHQ